MKPKVEWEMDSENPQVTVIVDGEEVAWLAVDKAKQELSSLQGRLFRNGEWVGTIYGAEKHTCKAKPQLCATCGKEMNQ